MIFVGSYLPLSLILLVQNFDYGAFIGVCINIARVECELPLKNPVTATTIFVACIICFGLTS